MIPGASSSRKSSIIPGEKGLMVSMEYNSMLWRPTTIVRMAECWLALLQEILRVSSTTEIGALRMLPSSEYQAVVYDFNHIQKPYPALSTWTQLFEQQAATYPQNVAVFHGSQTLTYQQLDALSNRLAHALRAYFTAKRGVSLPIDSVVGVCIVPSLLSIVCIVAVFKAGCAYLALDPSHPASRRQQMLIISDAKLLLCIGEQGIDSIPASTNSILAMSFESAAISTVEKQFFSYSSFPLHFPLHSCPHPRSLAYVVFTSGSTGEPKGVCVEHRALCNIVSNPVLQSVNASMRLLNVLGMTFDVAIMEWALTLAHGGAFCILENANGNTRALLGKAFAEAVQQFQITHLYCTPATLATVPQDVETLQMLRSLIVCSVGGEACPEWLVRKWENQIPQLTNGYGPTETAIACTYFNFDGKQSHIHPISTIGYPLPNYQLYILDACLQPVPIGVIGELYVSGAGVARGYIGKPEMTAQRFVPCPFDNATDEEGRMYKTGDLAKWQEDGTILYIGRSDNQVKVRGVRIELEEVGIVVEKIEGIKHAVVLFLPSTTRPDAKADALHAFCMVHTDSTLTARDIELSVKARLPSAFMPSSFRIIELPFTNIGKIDKIAVKKMYMRELAEREEKIKQQQLQREEEQKPEEKKSETGAHSLVTATPIATAPIVSTPFTNVTASPATLAFSASTASFSLLSSWRRLLSHPDLGTSDNFFEFGGNSILAVQAYDALPTEWKTGAISLKLHDLFTYTSVQSIVKLVEKRMGVSSTAAPVVVTTVTSANGPALFVPISAVSTSTPAVEVKPAPPASLAQSQAEFASNLIVAPPSSFVAPSSRDIAIIGMSGIFPSARSVDELWSLILSGRSGFALFSSAELLDAGIPLELQSQPHFVPTMGWMGSVNLHGFDASFFKYSFSDAALIDPQQRIFLQTVWQAVEDAGYAPDTLAQKFVTGIFAGVGVNTHIGDGQVSTNPADFVKMQAQRLGNAVDFLCSRVAYKLGLTGPAITVQTACSSSLVAVHTACQSLISGDCDMALAGGVSFGTLHPTGYFYKEGTILSRDGKIRPFDANASGTVRGQGCGVVLLKPLAAALGDRDHIYGVIRGSAVNNDGSDKVSFTAPSVQGQIRCIKRAFQHAQVEPESIGYMECHATGTVVGDPIEFSALECAYRSLSKPDPPSQYCALGALKSSTGHLDAASGIAGFMKACLIIHHATIPPLVCHETLHPDINLEESPFFIPTQTKAWSSHSVRRAGVSSFGIGGTNVHVILEQAPSSSTQIEKVVDNKLPYLFSLSASSPSALLALLCSFQSKFCWFISNGMHPRLSDIAYTLHTGRSTTFHRSTCRTSFVASTLQQGLRVMEEHMKMWNAKEQEQQQLQEERETSPQISSFPNMSILSSPSTPSLIFLFPGQGVQYINMTLALASQFPLFRMHLDSLISHVATYYTGKYGLPVDLTAQTLFSNPQLSSISASHSANPCMFIQLSLFLVEIALSRTFGSLGVQPSICIGHSLGQYAACVCAGMFSFEQGCELIVERARWMDELWREQQKTDEKGAMLYVRTSSLKMKELLIAFHSFPTAFSTSLSISVAAVNSPNHCTVSGLATHIAELHAYLTAQQVKCGRLDVPLAFHSPQINPALTHFEMTLQKICPMAQESSVPVICNLTGTPLTISNARNPHYWLRHSREAVQFQKGVETIVRDKLAQWDKMKQSVSVIWLEMGIGRTLLTFAKQDFQRIQQEIIAKTVENEEKQQKSTEKSTDSTAFPWNGILLLRSPSQSDSFSVLQESMNEPYSFLSAIGEMWNANVKIDWEEFYASYSQNAQSLPSRISLPTYPFRADQRVFIREPPQSAGINSSITGCSCSFPVASASSSSTSLMPHVRLSVSPLPSLLPPSPPSSASSTTSFLVSILSDLFAEQLGTRTEAHSDFFDMGGDSFSAVQLLNALKNRLPQLVDAPLSSSTLLSHSTPYKLALLLQNKHGIQLPASFENGLIMPTSMNTSRDSISSMNDIHSGQVHRTSSISYSISEDDSSIMLSPTSDTSRCATDSIGSFHLSDSLFKSLPSAMALNIDCMVTLKTAFFSPSSLLLLIHPIGGEIYNYRSFSHFLPSEMRDHITVCAFRACSLDGTNQPFSSIPEQAKSYLSHLYAYLEKHKPNWPGYIFIGGHSYGGTVAYEMCVQHSQFPPPTLPFFSFSHLFLVDSPHAGCISSSESLSDAAGVIAYIAGDRLKLSATELRQHVETSGMDILSFVKSLDPQLETMNESVIKTWIAHERALRTYVPSEKRLWNGPILYVKPSRAYKQCSLTWNEAWDKYVSEGQMTVLQVEGDHLSMMKPPYVKQVVETIVEKMLKTYIS
ncbi:hypothetical protein I4U23_017242 [Adineta vaga]|nr:hypothetical protein I4U23_017242 [Adineta vaga]